MGQVVHFEITADDAARANRFYADVFGWVTTEFMEGYSTVKTGEGDGIDGAIMNREFQAQPAIIWLAVENIEEAAQKVKTAGGSLVNEKQIIEGIGETVYARDTEGNVFGMIKPDPRM